MSAYLKHGELGKAYPDVYKMPTRIDYDIDSLGAYNRPNQYRREHIELKEKPNWSAAKSTALHEIQHPIQAREGWAKGGSPNDFLNGGVINPQTGQQYTIEEAYDAYRKLPGEAEARLTQRRMNLDASQRLEHYPYDMGEYGLDIPMDQLIVRGLLK